MKNNRLLYKSYLFIILFGLLFTTKTQATHYLGGELTYTCLGNNQYSVRLVAYTDCSGIGNPNSASVFFSSNLCNSSFNISLPILATYPQEITPDCSNTVSVCNGGTSPGIEKYVYEGTVTLPPNCSDWRASWSSCCRNSAAINLNSSVTSGYFISTNINDASGICNNSPTFNEDTYPIRYGCVSDTNYLDFSTVDVDGDSLIYSLVPVLQNATTIVPYAIGFSGSSPFAGSVFINSSTGMVTVVPNSMQSGYIAVLVEEYRNCIKIGEVTREIMAYFQNCSNNTLPKLTSVNGTTNASGPNLYFNATANAPLNLNIGTYDAEVVAGTQTLTSTWMNAPTNATIIGGSTSSPSFSWTPTNADVGTHLVSLRLEDNACTMTGMNTYNFYITVQSGPITNNAPVAVDDYYTIASYQLLTADLLQNDTDPDGNNLTLTNIVTPPTKGTVSILSNNQVHYIANQNYVGIDSFFYEVCDDGTPSLCDQAAVYIVLNYNEYYSSDTVAAGVTTDLCFFAPSLTGTLVSATPQTDSFFNATIQNIDLSTGCVTLHADSVATDSMTFLLCDSNGECVLNHMILGIDIGVWPGDTDTSQMVNHYDLLNIGYAYGNTGTARNPASIVWDGYLTPDWTKVMPVSNINFKHIDCNGDGIINAQDTVAIANNWGKSYTYNKSGAGIIPLYVDTVAPTSYITSLPVILGTSTIPANDVYGLAFTITYDTAFIEPNTIDISIDTSWLGTAGTDLISIHKDFYNDGIVQVAITRTDGFDEDGFGRIANLDFTIQDDIMLRGEVKFPFSIEGVKAIDASENPVSINPQQTEVTITTNTNNQYISRFIKVFPNPASDILNIQTEDLRIEQVTLMDVTGKIIQTTMVNQQPQTKLYLENIPKGIYMLSIQTDKGQVHKKISILK